MMIYLKLFTTFFKIGAFSFGGGYAMIPLIQKEIVNIHQWIPLSEFLDIIAISQMTPGPIAVNAATFVGHKIAGVMGSILATFGVIAPSFLIILGLALLFAKFRHTKILDSFFMGVRPVVIALIIQAALSIAINTFTGVKDLIITFAVFIGLFILKINPLIMIAVAAFLGIAIY